MTRKKKIGSKGKNLEIFKYFKKIFWKMSKFLTYTLTKSSQNIFAYSFVSEHSKHFFIITKKAPDWNTQYVLMFCYVA